MDDASKIGMTNRVAFAASGASGLFGAYFDDEEEGEEEEETPVIVESTQKQKKKSKTDRRP